MTTFANVTAITDYDALYHGAVFARPIDTIEFESLDIDDWSWYEADTLEQDGARHTVIVRSGQVCAIVANGATYGEDDFDDYVTACEAAGIEPMRDDTWYDLFNGGSDTDGPMNSTLYPLEGSHEDDALSIAAAIADLTLCVVVIDDNVYLAVTGAQSNFTWEIVEAHIRAGYLPPFAQVRELPSQGRRGESERDRAIVAISLHSMDVATKVIAGNRAQLVERAGWWINGQ